MLRLRTKLILGLTFLFAVTLAISMQGIYRIYQLDRDARLILQQNLHSIVYCNNMLQALETRPVPLKTLQENLVLQQRNVTEHGEDAATANATDMAKKLQADPANEELIRSLRHDVLQVAIINQEAIARKSAIASKTASNAILALSVFTLLSLAVYIIFIFSFPQIISRPVGMLATGIRQIAEKNYRTRIDLRPGDEFGQLAAGINNMAEKLYTYENSNIEQIKAEKTRIETIINLMHDGVIGFDEKRNILFMNTVAKRLCGQVKAPGNTVLDAIIHHPAQQQLTISHSGQPYTFVKEVMRVENNRDVIGEVIVLRDISAIQELAAAKTKFIATASHELKTPIASMQMSLGLLADSRTGPLQPAQRELVSSLEEDVDRILKISSEILDATDEQLHTI
ncbi:histidine kinase dimerization/phospho-acceptor domain-containing protein [Chitinophaga varians]|uniref:histidine kinase dimerization/phospho-acceptor domain-containing protein n=1 Tax=Chitinophaga varians TaxID=2202339 RepID=UPI00165F9ED1|nr:histidine kinase dimerization/phospho-acceptor domain-containing protein [Chitinophaga varians]MBC9909196.1 HAMP domain-containing protein [Chitinophaga varians]